MAEPASQVATRALSVLALSAAGSGTVVTSQWCSGRLTSVRRDAAPSRTEAMPV